MRYVLLIIVSIGFLFNSVVLAKIYPLAASDCFKWIEYAMSRFKIYDVMFALFFWLAFILGVKGSPFRLISCLMLMLAAGSAIDKCFGITTYLKSDILLIIISIAISVYVFIRERKQRG